MNKKMFSLFGLLSLAVATVPFAVRGEAKQAKATSNTFTLDRVSNQPGAWYGSCISAECTNFNPQADWVTFHDSNSDPHEGVRLLDRYGVEQYCKLETVGTQIAINRYAPTNYYGYIFEIDAGATFTIAGNEWTCSSSVSFLCKTADGLGGEYWWNTYTPGLSTSKQNIYVEVGKSETLNLSNSAGDANPIVTWTSSNADVATVSGSGVVTGVGEGTTTIKARVCKEELSYNVTVSPASATQSGIRVKSKVVETYKGQSLDLSKIQVVSMYGEDEGAAITVTSEMISGTYDVNTVGDYTLTVTSGSFTDTFTLRVKDIPATNIGDVSGTDYGNNSPWGTAFYLVFDNSQDGKHLILQDPQKSSVTSHILVNDLPVAVDQILNTGGNRYEFWINSYSFGAGDTIKFTAGMPVIQYTGTVTNYNAQGDGEFVPSAELKNDVEFVYTPSGWVKRLACSMEAADASVIEEGSLLANLAGYNPAGTKSALKNVDQTLESLVYTKDSEGHAARYFSHLEENASATEIRFYLPGNAYKAEERDTQIYGFSFKYRLVDVNAVVGTEAGTTYEDGVEGTRPASTTTSYMIQYVANSGSKYHCYDANLIADGQEHTFELNVACPSVNGFNIKLFRFQGEIILSDLVAKTVETEKVAVQQYVDTYMHMDHVENDGSCTTEGWYTAAKEALNSLTSDQRSIFASDATFASAYSRLQAWAVANNETLTISSTGVVTVSSNNSMNVLNGDNAALITIIAAMSCVALLGTALIIRKRKLVK